MPRGKKSLSSLQQQGDRQWGGPTLPGGVLTPALAEFCQSGTSIVLASCDHDGRPIVGRGLACRIEPDGKARLVLRKSSNPKLLKALTDGARFAVTFTQPSTHRSIQLKAPAARIVDANVGDAPAAIAQTTAFSRDLMDVGYSESFAKTYCGFEPHDLVTLTFLPEHAFVQTPGPNAGSALQ
ncbi:MAG TPA: pyridoxamine 5'-phosphate oxidase family protein [Aestuariivirga sp.]|nr:pyridoxamine 5'-phosphate oxidase family protein [Aestuariivirga sp.]